MLSSCLAIDEWKQIKIIENETEIKKKTLITTLDKLPKEYKLSVEVKPTSLPKKGANILRFIAGGNSSKYGSRIPSIVINNSGSLNILTAINGRGTYKFTTVTEYKENKWIHIEISQIHEAKGYNFTIIVNGKQEHTVINDLPEEFHQVKCYVSTPGFPSQKGFVRNLFVYYQK